MNHDYKTKYDQIRENQPGQPDQMVTGNYYPNAGYNRNLAFVWPNGSGEAFNYAYLVRIRFEATENAIYIVFTTHTVKIEGYGLQALFFELFDQRNRIIECIDERYRVLADNKIGITKITVSKNNWVVQLDWTAFI